MGRHVPLWLLARLGKLPVLFRLMFWISPASHELVRSMISGVALVVCLPVELVPPDGPRGGIPDGVGDAVGLTRSNSVSVSVMVY